MSQGHKQQSGEDATSAYSPVDIPRFKHKAPRTGPRYAPVLGAIWLAALYLTIKYLLKGIHGTDIEWHYIGDAMAHLINMILVWAVWLAWDREERFPEALPRREFDRRYPPSTGSGPTLGAGERSQSGGRKLEPSHADPDIIVKRER